MKTILCYGDSNTWGYPPTPNAPRYGTDVRWGSVLRTSLGAEYTVIEEGLNGRTTVWNDPIDGEFLNGKTYLVPCLRSHAPLDLVIIALGANDLKSRFALSPGDIAEGAGALVEIVQRSEAGVNGGAPKVLLICPPPLTQLKEYAHMFVGGEAKSRLLAPEYQRVAQEQGCGFLNAGDVIRCSDGDGLHFDPGEQQKLGRKVAEMVREMMG